MPGGRARQALADGPGSRFADVRWVAETGSTNDDAMELARQGEPEGVVVVADHQRAGRGRAGRTWEAPTATSLLLSVLLRPPARVAELATAAVAVSAVEAIEATAGVIVRLKWPNDLVWPGDGSAPDRKLAGVLAEADWPAGVTASSGPRTPAADERLVVVVGIGINVRWPDEVPDHLVDLAVALDHITDRPVDREDLLVSLLQALGPRYERLVAEGPEHLRGEWRERSATLGRRVRIELGPEDVVGTAVDFDEQGHLAVETLDGRTLMIAVGDVVHLRHA